MIEAQEITKAFGLRPVLRGISFQVERGNIAALLGPNGSGKTTLVRILAALSRPTSGTIRIGGWTLPREADHVRAQLGVVAHLPLLYDDLTAEENLRFFARLYSVESRRIVGVLERVGLARRAHDPLHTFSRGMQQRLAIARAMLHEPAVMLLDEPYTGLDVNGVKMLDDLLHEWKSLGCTVIMSTHDLDRVTQHCDHVLILNNGKIITNQPTAEIPDLAALFTTSIPA